MKKALCVWLALALCAGLSVRASASAVSFDDVFPDYWAYPYIQQAFEDGVVVGTDYDPETGVRLYSPEDPLTVAEFTVILVRAFYPAEAAEGTGLTWYDREYEVLQEHDVYSGLGVISLSGPVSRFQMAQMAYNVMADRGAAMPAPAELGAVQADIPDWDTVPEEYREAVAGMYLLGILVGVDDAGTFSGGEEMTRGQAAVVYCRIAGAVGRPEPPAPEPSEEPSPEPSGEPAPETSEEPSPEPSGEPFPETSPEPPAPEG